MSDPVWPDVEKEAAKFAQKVATAVSTWEVRFLKQGQKLPDIWYNFEETSVQNI